jgi:multiple sugar transport system substrate-binding protein
MKKLCLMMVLMLIMTSLFFIGNVQAEKGVTTIRVWDRQVFMETTVKMFNQKMEGEGKNIRAKFELIPYDQQVSKFMAALAAENAPDIYSLDLVQYPYFISSNINAFRDVTEEAKALPYFEELPQQMLALGMREGRIYALPASIDLSSLIWNKDLFKEAGLNPDEGPATWNELVKYGEKLTKDLDGDGVTDQWGFALAGGTGGAYMFYFLPFIWGNGGDMLSNDGTEILFNSSQTIEAVQFWKDLVYKYKIAPKSSINWSSADRYNAFVAGKLAMFLGGNFNILELEKDAPNLHYGITFIPKPESGQFSSFAGGDLIGITTQSKYPEAAWEFIKFYLSGENQIEVLAKQGVLPINPVLYDNEYFKTRPHYMEFAKFLSVARAPYSVKYNELYDPMQYSMEKALLDLMSVEDAIREAAEKMEKVIK